MRGWSPGQFLSTFARIGSLNGTSAAEAVEINEIVACLRTFDARGMRGSVFLDAAAATVGVDAGKHKIGCFDRAEVHLKKWKNFNKALGNKDPRELAVDAAAGADFFGGASRRGGGRRTLNRGQPRQCYVCGAVGHVQRQCPHAKPPTPVRRPGAVPGGRQPPQATRRHQFTGGMRPVGPMRPAAGFPPAPSSGGR